MFDLTYKSKWKRKDFSYFKFHVILCPISTTPSFFAIILILLCTKFYQIWFSGQSIKYQQIKQANGAKIYRNLLHITSYIIKM